MFNSLRNSAAGKPAVQTPPTPPTTFQQKKNQFAPPPVRNVAPPVSPERSPSAPPPPPPPLRPRVQEEEPEGEWAEVLYDYSSEVRRRGLV
jgi:abl interactor 2